MNNKFWKWVRDKTPSESGEAEEERTLFLDGAIGGDDTWYEDNVTPALFKSDLDSGKGPITVWINSPGGDVWAAAQIYNMLLSYTGKVTVKIDGLAASAASVIAMAGDEVLVSPVSMLMIHNPATAAMGDKDDLAQAISMLDSVKDSILNAYVKKTGLSKNKLSKLMDDETWMDANKAVELGFADRVMERPDLYHEEEPEKKVPEQDDPDEDDPEKKKSDPDSEEDQPEKEPDDPKKKDEDRIRTGFMYSSRQMAAAFTNKVKNHYKTVNTAPEKPVIDIAEGRSVDALMDRLNLLHTMM
ncbi:MAG: Clp protease ClpP [Lachnospiraceae bacterium]|jgi:ATP-dependent Clp protease protease subunit|nr:Clp protease ClpP [Lachnospiraceae bacterium]MCH4027342.1 Clp protease ClpP [Lachnospiraceae bacterium]MCH4065182.1 Clp protease ClpP [Lachnospiraceae bacterium]